MSGRTERCIRCGTQLLVPIEAQTVKCPVCEGITQLRPNNNFSNPIIITSYSLPAGGGSGSGYSYYPQQAAMAIPRPRPRPGTVLVPRSPYGRKRAVVCGVSYLGQKCNVKGSVNDVNCMRYFLVEKMGFPIDSILVLTGRDPNYIEEITLLKVMLF